MNDRKIKLFKTRDYELALKRRRLILDQLMQNGKMWLCECASNAMINKLVKLHCHHSQRAYALSGSSSMISVPLGCRINSLAGAKDLSIKDQRDNEQSLHVGEADQAAHNILLAFGKTVDVQRVAGVLVGDTTLDLQQKILAPVHGATRKAHKEEPFSRRGKLLQVSIVTD